VTAEASVFGVLQALIAQLTAFEALLLATAGLHKLIWHERARGAARQFAGVPAKFAVSAVYAVAGAELLASVLLWLPAYRLTGAVLAVLLWTGYLLLMLIAIAQGRRDVDCGCSFGADQRPLGGFQILRNGLLLAIALMVAAGYVGHLAVASLATQMLPAFAMLALYGALDQVMSLPPMRRGELL
jgi:hypothetical protein